MDLDSRLKIINQSIEGLEQNQRQMWRGLTSDIAESSESVMADVGKLSDHVYRLEVQFSKHYGKLKEVTKLVLVLLDKVQIIGSAVENINCSSDNINNGESLEFSLNRQEGKVSNPDPSEKKEDSRSALDEGTGSTKSNLTSVGTSNLETKVVQYGPNIVENEHGMSLVLENKKHVEENDKRKDSKVNVESHHSEKQNNLQELEAARHQSIQTNNVNNFYTTNASTRTSNSGPNIEIPSVLTEKVRKNDFGYKQKRSDLTSDNRVDFHSNQSNRTTYPGRTEYKTIDRNIKPKQTHSFRFPKTELDPSFEDFGDSGYIASSDEFDPPRDIHGWLRYASQITHHSHVRLQSGRVKRGRHGHDVILVLDTSERMRGSKFEEMKQSALEYVNGIQQVQETRGLADNIGLAVFGKETRLLHESTCDYQIIKNLIHQLKAEGESPLVCGLIVGMAGVQGGAVSQVMENAVQGYMIVFTDGSSEQVKPQFERDVNPLYLTGDFRRHVETSSVLQLIATHAIKIFYVPVGQHQSNAIMEEAVSQTRGKIIKKFELHRLIKMTQVMLIAARVASQLRHSPDCQDRESIGSVIESTGNSSDRTEDCIDMVVEFLNPMDREIRRGMFTELKCKTLQLGDRVRRGPYWNHDNQDSNMPGTVVGQDFDGNIWVEWDSGHVNVYLYNEAMHTFGIIKVNEPRKLLSDEMIAVGCRVVRGNDWTFDNEDGGPGSAGTVLNVKPDGNAVVRWDNKLTKTYKVGCNGLIEVQLCDHSINDRSMQQQPYQITEDSAQSENKKYNKDLHQHNYIFNRYVLPVNAESATWEYQENESTWKEYPKDINARIEKAYQRRQEGRGNLIIQMDRTTYRLDFKSMQQEHAFQKTRVQIRRKNGSLK